MSDPDTPKTQHEKRDLTICNKKGLHARPAAKFVRLVNDHEAEVWVSKDNQKVAGDAIMDLLMLAAAQGAALTIEARGPDATAVLDALTTLITDKFGEDE